MDDRPALRVSDADREQVVTQLHSANAEGRITVDELSERIDAAYAARTDLELRVLLADLPGGGAHPTATPGNGGMPVRPQSDERRGDWIVAIMSSSTRKGRWRVRRQSTILAVMGGADLDLRDAELSAPEVEITAISIMGSIDLIVPEGVRIEMGGFAFMGDNADHHGTEPVAPNAPVVRVRAYSLMGAVTVKRKRRRETIAEHLGMGTRA